MTAALAGQPASDRARLTTGLTATVIFLTGMALGQLIGGPVSDQYGRRRLLLAAVIVMTIASVLCALTPSIGVMMAARFVQGFAGGWAMVIGRAVIVDLARGARLVRVLNVIAGVGGIAPIGGLGGQDTAVPMAFLMIACTVLSMAGLVLARPRRRPRGL